MQSSRPRLTSRTQTKSTQLETTQQGPRDLEPLSTRLLFSEGLMVSQSCGVRRPEKNDAYYVLRLTKSMFEVRE